MQAAQNDEKKLCNQRLNRINTASIFTSIISCVIYYFIIRVSKKAKSLLFYG